MKNWLKLFAIKTVNELIALSLPSSTPTRMKTIFEVDQISGEVSLVKALNAHCPDGKGEN